ncbi:MAG TPA: hypothetical protein VKB75_05190 [Jatrophihabitans sp.]|nr:hypothetical protein [Jatrophihabitans sp.]
MTETPIASSASAQAPPTQRPVRHTTAWRGWIVFGGLMLMLVGAFQAIEGFVALFEDHFYVVSRNGLVVHLNYTAWGWIMLALAAANIAAGVGVLRGHTWARIWAIAAASLSIIANLGFTSAYPLWVFMVVTLEVVVIYALCVHWDEARR